MSFRNMKSGKTSGNQSYEATRPKNTLNFDVLKIRMKRSGDSGMWHDIYKDQVGYEADWKGYIKYLIETIKGGNYAVDDWVVWTIGILLGVGAIGAGIGGFKLGQKYSDVGSIKQLAESIPIKIRDSLSKFGFEPDAYNHGIM